MGIDQRELSQRISDIKLWQGCCRVSTCRSEGVDSVIMSFGGRVLHPKEGHAPPAARHWKGIRDRMYRSEDLGR
jgi:hypothetical protein